MIGFAAFNAGKPSGGKRSAVDYDYRLAQAGMPSKLYVEGRSSKSAGHLALVPVTG
jgi:hypothetical protein